MCYFNTFWMQLLCLPCAERRVSTILKFYLYLKYECCIGEYSAFFTSAFLHTATSILKYKAIIFCAADHKVWLIIATVTSLFMQWRLLWYTVLWFSFLFDPWAEKQTVKSRKRMRIWIERWKSVWKSCARRKHWRMWWLWSFCHEVWGF